MNTDSLPILSVPHSPLLLQASEATISGGAAEASRKLNFALKMLRWLGTVESAKEHTNQSYSVGYSS